MLTPTKCTLEQYHQMIEADILDGQPVELLNGEIIETSPEGEPHAFYSHAVAKYLERLLEDELGNERAMVRQGKPITLPSTQSEPEPDLAIVQPLGRTYLQHHPYPDNILWLVEFSHASLKKDLDSKAKAYATAGIPEYWVVNLKAMELIVMRDPVDGEYRSQVALTDGAINPLSFPDVSVSIRRLLD